jgi:predicted O-methyltransferase YrrM
MKAIIGLLAFMSAATFGESPQIIEYFQSKPFYSGEGIASGNCAFNGAPEMGQFFDELQKKYPITTVIETGTYHGGSTAFFAKMFKQVHTIDNSEQNLEQSKQNLKALPNIQFHLGSSEKVLSTLLPTLKNQFVLLFLDAHWGKYWPLLDELEEISKTHHQRCIIVIDDVQVPGRSDIPFDKYKKRVCSFEYAKEKIEKIFDGYTVHYLIPANVQSRAKLVIIPKGV